MARKATATFPSAVTAWFATAARTMPWRGTRDPYRVWLSEVMLQQTQVATVVPYYDRFLKNFPTVAALAEAPLDEVLKLWAGLGYYSRARNLHRAAQKVARELGGRFPETLAGMLQIPGIGAYTAGAVLSIAFQRPEALVDGNVARVLSRVQLLEGDWRTGPGKAAVWDAARNLMAEAAALKLDPGDFNQALMELGATLCTPRAPECARCPVAAYCRALKETRQAEFPQVKVRAAVPVWKLRAWVVQDARGRILLHRRKDEGLFGGLYEMPMERIGSARAQDLRVRTPVVARLKHVLSHRELRLEARAVTSAEWDETLRRRPLECWSGEYESASWLSAAEIQTGKVALSTAQKKVLKRWLAAPHTRTR